MMGLDITAYKNVELVDTVSDAEEYEEKYGDDWEKYDYIHRYQDFPDRLPPMQVNGVYRFEAKFSFRAGSYSGYNFWREQLSVMALGGKPPAIWNDWARFTGKSFVELIHFSDAEGNMGTDVCKKLLKDFVNFQSLADQHEDEWFRQKYNDWRKAFEYAADNGYVDFH